MVVLKNSLSFLVVCIIFIVIVNISQAEAVENQAIVLMYHHFGDNKHPSTNIRLDQFDAQLEYLEENGFQVCC